MKGKLVGNKHPLYGTLRSSSTKEKISKSRMGKCVGKNNPMYGKKTYS